MKRASSDQDTRREALEELDRLRYEGDMLSGLLRRTAAHFSAAEADANDPIERHGRRIGRALAAVAFLGFCAYLYVTYVR